MSNPSAGFLCVPEMSLCCVGSHCASSISLLSDQPLTTSLPVKRRTAETYSHC